MHRYISIFLESRSKYTQIPVKHEKRSMEFQNMVLIGYTRLLIFFMYHTINFLLQTDAIFWLF